MKHLIILLTLILSINLYSQNYQDRYKADICACIETKKNTMQIADKIYNACFVKHMTTYAVFIDAEIKEEDKTRKFIAGQQVRRELNQRFKYELVYTCDAYVDVIEGKKQDVIQQFRSKKIDSTHIDKLNETVAMQPLWANYFNRGQYYYYIGDLQKAEQDVLKSIEENPLNEANIVTAQENFLLALIYEEQKQYTKAIAIYDAINSKGINPSVEMMKAIVSRKSNGYIFKSKTALKTEIPPVAPKEKLDKEPVKTRQRTSPRTLQTNRTKINTDKARSQQKDPVLKSKDSAKSLRKLFKLK